MSSSLIIDEAVRTRIKEIKEYARANPRDMNKAKSQISTDEERIKHTPNSLRIPMRFLATYTIDDYGDWQSEHISISIHMRDRMPSVPAMMLIMEAFQMQMPSRENNGTSYIELVDKAEGIRAINFVIPISEHS